MNTRGKWNYLYRAVDKDGKTVDCLPRHIRHMGEIRASAVRSGLKGGSAGCDYAQQAFSLCT
jgi:hypothetical protein